MLVGTSSTRVDAASLDLDKSVALYKRAQARFSSDEESADAARRRVVALQAGDPETIAIWKTLIAVSTSFNEAYDRLGVLLTDDDLAGESMYNPTLPEVRRPGGARHRHHRRWRAVCVRARPGGADDRAQGRWWFRDAATDLAAIRYRVNELGADRIIYVVGMPQAFHFEQVFRRGPAGRVPDA